jgi:hypothetical protein
VEGVNRWLDVRISRKGAPSLGFRGVALSHGGISWFDGVIDWCLLATVLRKGAIVYLTHYTITEILRQSLSALGALCHV